MSVIDDLRQFFLPEPTPRRMERKEPSGERRPRRPPRRGFKKRPGGLTKFALETAHLPASVVDQIEIDFKMALAFTYTGRADYRAAYIAAGISADEIPEEELEELPGAGGIRIPILGWGAPSVQVWKIAKDWLRSVTTWSDVSRALEADLIWKKTLAKWGVENLRVVEEHPETKRKGVFVIFGEEPEEPTPEEKKQRLEAIRPELLKERPDVDYESVWYRAQEKLGKQLENALTEEDKRQGEEKVGKVWDTLQRWVEQGQTFGMSDESVQSLKIAEEEISVLETSRQIEEKYPLVGAILDWVRYGDVRSQRIPKFLGVKEQWLTRIQSYLTQDEIGPDGETIPFAPLRARIDEFLDREKRKKYDVDERADLINGLWRDFVGFAREGYTFGIPERLLDTLKLVEYRGLELEVKDFLDQWSDDKLFRVYLWQTKPFGLRVKLETATRRFLEKNPKVRSFLYKTLSPFLSKDLTNKLLNNGRLLPNRLVEAFLDRTFKQRFPEEILAGLRGTLSPEQFKLIRGSTLAELDALVEKKLFPAKVYNQLKNSLYVKWRRWFLPGRFLEWAGRNLTKVQDSVFQWLEEQIVKKNLVGKALDNPIIRAAGSRDFVDRALGRKPSVVKAFAKGAAVRKAAARVALSLWRRGFKAAARWLVKIVQGVSAAVSEIASGPLGVAITAAITTAIRFVGGKVVKWVWEKTKGFVKAFTVGLAAVATIPASVGLAIGGCGCFLLLAPFLLLVFIIAPAFQPGELGGWLGEGEQLVRVEKTVNPSNVAVGPHPMVDYKLAVYNLSGEEEVTAGTLVDEYDGNNFTPFALGGADNSQPGKLVWTVDSIPAGGKIEKNYDGFINTDTDKHVVNNATFTATLGDGTVSDTASMVVFVGAGGEGRPPSGWPTAQGCITQGPRASGSGATHSALEAVDIAPVVQGSPTDADLEVFATHDGTAYVDRNAGYGPYITVVSPAGFTTVYGHLEEAFAVNDGESVYAGQRLGKVFVGVIGESSGTHLHYEFRDLQMEPPYIPAGGLRKCVGRTNCNFCFGE